MKHNKTTFKLSLLAGAMLVASAANALDIKQQGNAIGFDSLANTQYQVTVRAPDGTVSTFKINNGNFSLSAEMLGLKQLDNGLYKYELTPVFNAEVLSNDVRKLNDETVTAEYMNALKTEVKPESGVFTIKNNSLVDSTLADPSSNKGSAIVDADNAATLRDQVFLDDIIVDGSACIGFDCVNGESFGFDTIRLKENNMRIKAQDTSSTASFPSNDWQITFNDSANGGANKFSIDDIDAGRTPFTIEAGAPSHSLYVDGGGRLGLGTSTPVVDIHSKSGNTPTLRLEQDGSSGFTPQTWDVAGNEAGFFVRDATNGSTLPFRIRPGAPSSAIDISPSGKVGIGATAPEWNLHVRGSGAVISQTESTDSAVQVRLKTNTENRRILGVDSASAVKTQVIFNDNDVKIAGATDTGANLFATFSAGSLVVNGTLTTTGTTCSIGAQPAGCDLVFSEDYKLPTIEDHAIAMYKNSFLPNVGPTIENQPFNLTEKTGGMLNELEKAHIYIAQLNEQLNEKTAQLDSIEKRLLKLEIK